MSFVELLFFAYRDFVREPDDILAEFGFGRAHHRVLHFVQRHPGLRVADLLGVLNITKQSLARVLRQLVEQGYIEQRAGVRDRRSRLLYVTQAGEALFARLVAPQLVSVARALEAAGLTTRGKADGRGGAEAVERFLAAMVSDPDRDRVARFIAAGAAIDDIPEEAGGEGAGRGICRPSKDLRVLRRNSRS